ncbi:MAG: gamma-glutamyltransferase family protein [Bacteroidota bacterium]
MTPLKQIIVFFMLFSFIAFPSCQNPETNKADNGVTSSQYATSKNGMVATAHPLATQAGKQVLENGGNAADAAVAVSFTLAVVEPAMSGLGGRLQAIVLDNNGKVHGIDATTQAPGTYDKETAPQAKYGYAVIGVPGVVAGVAKLNEAHGSMPLKELLAPAIKLANEGFYQLPDQVLMQSMVKDQLMEFNGSKKYFILPGDTMVYGPNDLLVQKDLANTLTLIAENGPQIFYKGEIAEKMVADVQVHGGALTMESLAEYEALNSEILSGSYKGIDVYGLWLPSFGATTIEILHILENLPMKEYSDAEWASAMYQAIKLGYEDRFMQMKLESGDSLISKEYAKTLSEKIQISTPIEASLESANREPIAWQEDPGHTTHFTIVDKNGMVVSLTQSIGPIMGSRVVTPGLGFLYAATLGGYLGPMEPYQRAASHISPMILTKDGSPFMGLGAAGGDKINSAIVQAVCQVVDKDKSLIDALEAPRVHPSKEGILIEIHDSLAWSDEDLKFLEDNGFLIKKQNQPFRFGRVHAIMKKGDEWIGAADPDGEGTAGGPEK